MGKGWKQRRGGGRGGGRGGSYGNRSRDSGNWDDRVASNQIARSNTTFEGYYDGLDLVPESERPTFWQAMRSDLPNSFRFTGSRGHALTVQKRLIEHYIPEIEAVEYEGEKVARPEPVSWYPDGLAWSMTTPKNVIRRFPPFASFQKFLVSENDVGNITRQEIVSMIPPLFMDIKPGMTVLDLCAAPGSKSAQIIEMLHGGEEARVRKVLEEVAKEQGIELGRTGLEVDAEKDLIEHENDWSDDGRATGLLIANDKEIKRAQMLVHQCKRLNSPNTIVINHDASMFPSIKMPSTSTNSYMKFDRVLADVPCSGDGTVRKNFNVWKDWTPGNGLGLHAMQQRILVRALQMLKVGGRVVYSTCSLNPVENEAVVASAIGRCGGSEKVKLVDVSSHLPGLKRVEGLHKWNVMAKDGNTWSSWEDVVRQRESGTEHDLNRLSESMFPPTPEAEIPLRRCMRVYPHLQDTGGFFITVLEKQSEIKAKPESQPSKSVSQPAPGDAPISAIVDEIKHQTKAETQGAGHIEAADALAPPTHEAPDVPAGEESAAMRQNQPVTRTNGTASPGKRSLDEEDDAGASSKRLKTREDIDKPGPAEAEERQVHYPPPPAAELNDPVQMPSSTAEPAIASFPGKKKGSNLPPEEPFKYLSPDHSALQEIYNFYKLSPRFPRDRFMVRNATGEPVKAIYYTSTLARDILTENEGKGLKFVHCGVKMFVKQDVQNSEVCRWRIQAEGLPIIEPWIGQERIVRLTQKETLRKLLVEMFPRVGGDAYQQLEGIGERVRDMGMGCCVLRVEPDGTPESFQERLVMPLWRGLSSVNLMLPKDERKAMLLRLFNDNTPLKDNSKHLQQQAAKRTEDSLAKENGTTLVGDADAGAESTQQADGGVKEEALEAKQDAMLGERQNAQDQTREAAPGVIDEDDAFNKTV